MLQRWKKKQGKLDSVTLNALLTPYVTSFKISLGFRLQGDVVACGANKFGDSRKIPPQPKNLEFFDVASNHGKCFVPRQNQGLQVQIKHFLH